MAQPQKKQWYLARWGTKVTGSSPARYEVSCQQGVAATGHDQACEFLKLYEAELRKNLPVGQTLRMVDLCIVTNGEETPSTSIARKQIFCPRARMVLIDPEQQDKTRQEELLRIILGKLDYVLLARTEQVIVADQIPPFNQSVIVAKSGPGFEYRKIGLDFEKVQWDRTELDKVLWMLKGLQLVLE
jgi:hypothetical protein